MRNSPVVALSNDEDSGKQCDDADHLGSVPDQRCQKKLFSICILTRIFTIIYGSSFEVSI